MNTIVRWPLALLAGACLAAGAADAWAQAGPAAGRFLSVTGDVQVRSLDGKRRGAERGAEFREGDTIVTGPSALAQLRTADGGLVSVRADTEMKLDKFAYAGENDRNASFLVSLVKGGFRTITGLIGRANRDGYKVTTPSATIGIRGTHYELVHVLPQGGTPQAPAGTYNRVFDGITTMQNRAGVLLLVNRDQTAFVSLPGNVAPVLVTPPNPIFGKPTPVPRLVPQSSTGGSGPSAGGGDSGRPATGAVATQPATLVRPTTLTPLTTTVSPIDSTTTTIKSSTTTTISPTTSTLITPVTTTTTLSPTTSTLSTTTLTAPATTTISPATTTITPVTTTITPVTTTIAPVTTTIAPVTTTIAPATTTISPTTTTILK